MVDEKAPPKKQGLHGWKAALAVFGCGTLAAFGVFGVLVLIVGTFFRATSTGVSGEADQVAGAEQTGTPRDELPAGDLNVCENYVPNISDVTIRETLSSADRDDAQVEGFQTGERREVSGECSFSIQPAYGVDSQSSQWVMDFSYQALVFDPSGGLDEQAAEVFESEISQAEQESNDSVEIDDHDWAGESRSFYWVSETGESHYLVVSRTRSAVYTFGFAGDSADANAGAVSKNAFQRQAADVVQRLDNRFFLLIPE
ncbi:hypothetical protein ACOQFV_22940 [Nocardiopsis changdeensis]|uniref:DUF3558 domain-containing protein n=1 Tax=Nocardiopsis changdeensis TaxID=2831969 RepID=A0ABX8BKX1_9ACTN|nr:MULTISPECIES: hypothetical protein [Nocardiopsis]QUX21959.1 hypothetical protein KGD84_26925 [Nocardiopsis changdeensis]QYX37896.1 hypothetical protein K1J57_04320 [Nocardiopsis sp. MT53]